MVSFVAADGLELTLWLASLPPPTDVPDEVKPPK